MKKKKSNKLILWLIVVVIAIGAVSAFVARPWFFTGASVDGMIKVRRGASIAVVRDSIATVFGNEFANNVATLLRTTGADLSQRQGAFKVSEGDSPFKVMRLLRSGEESTLRFTFNYVRTKEEFAQRFSAKFMCDKEELLAALNDPEVCARYDRTPDNITGMLSPDSYDFFWDITPQQLLARFNDFDKRFWNDERRAKAKALGMTPHQLEVIASITEEETAKADERGTVARLYINRVQQRMPLQADPTVKFAIGDFTIKRLTIAMTRVESPYNTYLNPGLPPGPIRLPEKRTIDAALNSTPHSYVYMCAKEDFSGYHNFATDYGTHMANARRYQAELNKRGIR